MKTLLKYLHNFGFFPAPALRLAALRILLGVFALYYLGSAYFVGEQLSLNILPIAASFPATDAAPWNLGVCLGRGPAGDL
jgi:hypothetical protein